MFKAKYWLFIMLLFSSISSSPPSFASENISIQEFYNYDSLAPLNAKLDLIEETSDFKLYRVDYDSVWGRRVPAIYMVPQNCVHPVPAIIFGHGFTGRKEDMRKHLLPLSENCYAAISIDMWYHGERNIANKKMYSKHLYQMREGLAGSVIDLRRAVDFLVSRSDEVSPDRISYLGGSMGGIVGALFAGVDNRIKSPVLVVGGADWSYLVKNSIVVQVDLSKDGMSRGLADLARKALAPVDPLNTAHLISPRPLLMINAKHDILVNPASNKKLFLRSKTPRKIIWFASGHGIPEDEAMPIVIDWFNKYLRDGHAADFSSVNEGCNTEPINIDMSAPLPPIIESIPLSEYFAYDSDLPLLSNRDSVATRNTNVSKYHIRFQSVRDRMVEGFLNIPKTSGATEPYPVAVFIHDVGDTHDNVNLLMDTLAENGIASVSINIYGFQNDVSDIANIVSGGPYMVRNLHVQAVQDVRRLLDFLEKSGSITMNNLTVIGEGTGGAIGIIASQLDPRIANLAAIDMPSDLYNYYIAKFNIQASQQPQWADITASRKALSPIEPINHVNSDVDTTILFIRNHKLLQTDYRTAAEMYTKIPNTFYATNTIFEDASFQVGLGNAISTTLAFINKARDNQSEDIITDLHNKLYTDYKGLTANGGTNGHALSEAAVYSCKIANIDTSSMDTFRNKGIVVNARVSCDNSSAQSVIAAVYSMNGYKDRVAYIELMDNGEDTDNAMGDGIYSGYWAFPASSHGSIKITAGGISEDEKPIVEKTTTVTH